MAQGVQISVLTHNLWLHYLTGAPNKDHRITHFLKNIGRLNYDVIVLQEVFVLNLFGYPVGFDLREQIIKESKDYGYLYHMKGDTPPSFFGQTSGLVILSKHPITQGVERRWYKINDFGTGKGFLHATLKINNEEVHVFNVHLDSHYPSTRLLQLQELCHNFLPPLSNKIIVAGDFNVSTQDTKEYEDMMKIVAGCGLRDVYAAEESSTLFTNKKGCVDHIIISPNIELISKDIVDFRDTDGERVSDHYGVSAYLKFSM